MSVYQESFSKILASSYSSDSRDSNETTITVEDSGKDEEFYEEIEAPKFVDFTSADHFKPDDRFWFCQRVGCDQKHEEDMDSETIYKNFVLRVMAARSPNVKLRKFLDRKCPRSPIKCPSSAPPKSSKPRLSRLALLSSISGKMMDERKKVVRPLLKPNSTPVTKGKPVAAKYLTTPRNKKCPPNENSFRSVQNLKSTAIEVPKSRSAAKSLVFHSPKKAIKTKASLESRTPISKLCERMSELEISSQKKRVLGYSSKPSKNVNSSDSRSGQKLKNKPEKQTCVTREAKSTISSNSATKRKLTKQDNSKKLGIDRVLCSRTIEGEGTTKEVKGESELKECRQEESLEQSGKCLHLKKIDNSKSEITKIEEKDGILKLTPKCSENSMDQPNENISSVAEHEYVDSDNKENATESDGNRMHNGNQKQTGRTIFGVQAKGSEVKKIVPASDKHVKEVPVMKFKKPKPTNPKPFRLRTDERGILREAKLEEKASQLAPEIDTANPSTPSRKLRIKQLNDAQKKERSSKAVTSLKEEFHHSLQPKSRISPLKSKPIQKLEKISKIKSALQKLPVKPQGLVKPKKKIVSFLIPGQKLDVIHEVSPEVLELKKARMPTEKSPLTLTNNAAASRPSSSYGKQTAGVDVDISSHTKKLQ